MNYRMVLYTIGQMLKIVGIAIFIPMFVAIGFKENCLPYVYTILIFLGIGFVLAPFKPKDTKIYNKEATVSIGLAWILISLLGSLLYIFSGAIPSYTDAFFEMVSGITTTGATILTEIEVLPRGILFFRSLTNWLGGVGILVFILAITTSGDTGGIFLLRAESAGPNVGKMTNKLKNTARATYLIYIGLTLLQFICLLCTGIGWFDASTLSFSTAGTGGFTPTNQSVLSYNNLAVEIIITIFMFIFSINFYVYFLILTGKFISVLKNEELRYFFILFIVSILLVAVNLVSTVGNFWTALRYASFEVSSTMSSTGFAITDYNTWPTFSKTLILLLVVIGGCAGSTAGGFKMSRVVGIAKASRQKFGQILNPRKVISVRIDGKIQDESYINSLYFYFVAYIGIILISTLIVSFDKAFDFGTALSSVIATFNNTGPGIGIIGSMGNYSSLAAGTKWYLSLLMLVGRLEIFPIIVLLMPSTWKSKNIKSQTVNQ